MRIRPSEMSQAVKQSASRWSTLLEIVRPTRVDDRLPEVSVGLGDVALVDARELAVCGPDHCRCEAGVCNEDGVTLRGDEGGTSRVGIDDPAHGGGGEFVRSKWDFGVEGRGGGSDLGV